MSYFAYALKYRPQNFQEVIGQEHVVISLKNAILQKHVHHAYLFSGPRGTGKTSLARIFAKSLNCEQGPTVTPCEKCTSCVEIGKGASFDIIEIDGASNNSVDNIRDLRESAKLSAAHSRYKIYIIDEVHMLSLGAFNALLKTLEEPPAHVKFIFATTHPQKVLPTILSRCQKYQFSLIPLEKIVEKLKIIIKSENLVIEDNFLYAIARAASGSIRDAESLLDQLAPVVAEGNALKDVLNFLGIIDEESLNSTLKSVMDRDLPASLEAIDKISKDGKDLGLFLNALIEHFRNLLLAKVSGSSFKELSDISVHAKEALVTISKTAQVPHIIEIMDLLIEAKDLSHKLNTVRVPFELALIKFSYAKEIKSNKAAPVAPAPVSIKTPVSVQKNTQSESDLDDDIANLDVVDKRPAVAEQKPSGDVPLANDEVLSSLAKSKWREIIVHMQRTRAAIASHLALALPVSSQGTVLVVGFAKKNYFHKEIVETSKNLKFIEGAVSYILGKQVGVKFTLVDTLVLPHEGLAQPSSNAPRNTSSQSVQQPPIADAGSAQTETNDFINELLDTFGGNLHTNED